MNKKIYLIRHGESEGNIGPIRQSPESPLSEEGERQAKIISERTSNLNFDLLVSSPYVRTMQTAEVISKKAGKEILINDLFVERSRPSEQVNNPKNSASNIKSDEEYEASFIRNEKYKDGESFEEISTRAKKALNFLEELKEEKIVVVSHGMFIRVICATVLLGDLLDSKSCFEMMKTFRTKNTGITMIEKRDGRWRLTVWNDHAHFAEY